MPAPTEVNDVGSKSDTWIIANKKKMRKEKLKNMEEEVGRTSRSHPRCHFGHVYIAH